MRSPKIKEAKTNSNAKAGVACTFTSHPRFTVSAIYFSRRRILLLPAGLLFFGCVAEAAVQQLLQFRFEVHVVQADFVHARIVCGEVFQLGGGG